MIMEDTLKQLFELVLVAMDPEDVPAYKHIVAPLAAKFPGVLEYIHGDDITEKVIS